MHSSMTPSGANPGSWAEHHHERAAEPLDTPNRCPLGHLDCRSSTCAEEAAIRAEQGPVLPIPPEAERGPVCALCRGDGEILRPRSRRKSVCPSCCGRGKPVVIELVDGKPTIVAEGLDALGATS